MDSMALRVVLIVLSCLILSCHVEAKEDASSSSDLVLPKPSKVVKSKAGKVLAWSKDTDAYQEIHARSEVVELKPNGMLLPVYADADSLCYVLEGRADAGIIRPSGEATNTRYLRIGDTVAVPAGWVAWLWNSGRMKFRMFCVNKPIVEEPGESCNTFFLAGGDKKQFGSSILRGFSDQVLARMFDLNMKDARSIVDAQDEAVLASTKSENEIDVNEGMQGDLTFNMEIARPELQEAGGRMTVLDDTKMQILQQLRFGAVLVKLYPSSMVAPQWLVGVGQIIYITKGRGQVEVSNYEGQPVLNETLQAGDSFVIPPLHPHIVMNSGESPMEWICIHFTSRFYPGFLSGAKSVYRSLPVEYLAASFNTSVEVAEQIRESHERDKMFLKV